MAYSDKVLDHYENPRNVGAFEKGDDTIGTSQVDRRVRRYGEETAAHIDAKVAISQNGIVKLIDTCLGQNFSTRNGYSVACSKRLVRSVAQAARLQNYASRDTVVRFIQPLGSLARLPEGKGACSGNSTVK